MEKALSNLQSTIFIPMACIVATAAFCYLLVLPILNELGVNKHLSVRIAGITFILIIGVIFSNFVS